MDYMSAKSDTETMKIGDALLQDKWDRDHILNSLRACTQECKPFTTARQQWNSKWKGWLTKKPHNVREINEESVRSFISSTPLMHFNIPWYEYKVNQLMLCGRMHVHTDRQNLHCRDVLFMAAYQQSLRGVTAYS